MVSQQYVLPDWCELNVYSMVSEVGHFGGCRSGKCKAWVSSSCFYVVRILLMLRLSEPDSQRLSSSDKRQ